MEADDKSSKTESKVRNEKGTTESVCIEGEAKSFLISSMRPQGSEIRASPKLQVSALAKPGIASFSMQSILHFILKEVVTHD